MNQSPLVFLKLMLQLNCVVTHTDVSLIFFYLFTLIIEQFNRNVSVKYHNKYNSAPNYILKELLWREKLLQDSWIRLN